MATCSDCGKEFISKGFAKYGPECRWRHRVRRLKYEWTAERDEMLRQRYDSRLPNRTKEIARLLGWPRWVIVHRAQRLGLSRPKPVDWSDGEVQFLIDHAGERADTWIAKKLGRSLTAVVMKCKHMKLSRRVQRGYTMRELQLCFGCDHRTIERWMRQGKLAVRRRHTGRTDKQGDPFQLGERDIINFIEKYPMAFRLDKVDQFWFMDLITNGGLVKKALAAVGTEEPEEEAD